QPGTRHREAGVRDPDAGESAAGLPGGGGVPHRGAGDRARHFGGDPDPAAGDVRRLLRDAHLSADERPVHAGRFDARLGPAGGGGEPGQAFREHHAGGAHARGRARDGGAADRGVGGGGGGGAGAGGAAVSEIGGVAL